MITRLRICVLSLLLLDTSFIDLLDNAYSGRLPACNVDPPSILVQVPRSRRSRCIVKPPLSSRSVSMIPTVALPGHVALWALRVVITSVWRS
jgi:hypothetical protein